MNKKVQKNYHVFTNNMDVYTDTAKEAKEVYREWRSAGYRNIRIYVEFFENGEMIHEDYYMGCGEFPW